MASADNMRPASAGNVKAASQSRGGVVLFQGSATGANVTLQLLQPVTGFSMIEVVLASPNNTAPVTAYGMAYALIPDPIINMTYEIPSAGGGSADFKILSAQSFKPGLRGTVKIIGYK